MVTRGTLPPHARPDFAALRFLAQGAPARILGIASLELVLPLACSFRVELADGVRADTLRVLDQDGEALRLTESYGIYVTFREEAELSEGRSSVLECDERARTLVLEREGVEVARLPLALVPGETTVVRP